MKEETMDLREVLNTNTKDLESPKEEQAPVEESEKDAPTPDENIISIIADQDLSTNQINNIIDFLEGLKESVD